MPCRLLVILGAGASYDCASGLVPDRREIYRPPLVTELFEPRPPFTQILHHYPLAEAAAADIRPALSAGSIAVEAFLRERLKESEFEHDRRRYVAIPLYLQHLLFDISSWEWEPARGYTAHPDSYDRLISAALRTDQVTFVTLNYDDFLDRRLFINSPLTTMSSYLGQGEKWALIKLHGSVNWGRRVMNPNPTIASDDPYLAQTFANLGEGVEVEGDIVLRTHLDLRRKRFDETGPRLYYPALSAPLGSEDELVCPPEHVEYLKERLGHWDPLDVLVIGYSGLDQEVLGLLEWSERPIRSLWVVNGTAEAGEAAADRILENVRLTPGGDANQVMVVNKGFTAFAQGEELDNYIARIRAHAVETDEASRPDSLP